MIFPVKDYGLTQGWLPNKKPPHYGLDLAKGLDVPILSPVNGTVINIGSDPVGGKYIIVREDDFEHLEYYMGHCNSFVVKRGDHVLEGQQIAKMGKTGQATGYHTHFQIRRYMSGELLNPNVVFERKNMYKGKTAEQWYAIANDWHKRAEDRLEVIKRLENKVQDLEKRVKDLQDQIDDQFVPVNEQLYRKQDL